MKHTVIKTLAYALRIAQGTDRPDLRDHGNEIIDSLEADYLPRNTTVDREHRYAGLAGEIRMTCYQRVTNSNGDYLGDAAFDVTVRPSFEIGVDLTIEGIPADNHSLFEECDCGPVDDETEDNFEHWEDCQLGNEELYADDLGEELSMSLDRELTDEEYIELSDLKSHLAKVNA